MTRLDAAVAELVAALREELATEARPAVAQPDRLLSIEEAAAALGIGRTNVYSEISSGRLRSLVIGRRRRLVPAGAIHEDIDQASR